MRTFKLVNENFTIMRLQGRANSEIMILREADRAAKIEAVKAAREHAVQAKATARIKREATVKERVAAVKAMKLHPAPRMEKPHKVVSKSLPSRPIKTVSPNPPVILSPTQPTPQPEQPTSPLEPQPTVADPESTTQPSPAKNPDSPEQLDSKQTKIDKMKAARAAKLRAVLKIGQTVEELRLAEFVIDMNTSMSSPRGEPRSPKLVHAVLEELKIAVVVTHLHEIQTDINTVAHLKVTAVLTQPHETTMDTLAEEPVQPSNRSTERVALPYTRVKTHPKPNVEGTPIKTVEKTLWWTHCVPIGVYKPSLWPLWMQRYLLMLRRSRQPKLKTLLSSNVAMTSVYILGITGCRS